MIYTALESINESDSTTALETVRGRQVTKSAQRICVRMFSVCALRYISRAVKKV